MRKLLYLGAVLAGSAGFALAAYGAAASPAKPRPSVTALRVEQPPVIDGALDEDAWQKAPAAGDSACSACPACSPAGGSACPA